MHSSPIRPGDRRRVVVLGRPEAVHILDSARGQPRYWLCQSEVRDEIFSVADYELEDLIPGEPAASTAKVITWSRTLCWLPSPEGSTVP
jgi:hypothetical protein